MTEPIIAVLYHGPRCPDGFGAACVAHYYYLINNQKAIFYPIEPNRLLDDLSVVMRELPPETPVRCFDIGFTREGFNILSEYFTTDLVVIDHHRTTYEELVTTQQPPELIFDINQSGCVLAWKYFFPERLQIPLFLQYLEDRDLYTFKLKFSREVSMALNELCPIRHMDWKKHEPYFDQWIRYMNDLEGNSWLEETIALGKFLMQHQSKVLGELFDNSNIVIFGDYNIAICNCAESWLVSDLGNMLATRLKCDYALIYRIKINERGPEVFCSLRSINDFNVSAVAKKFGGGGHTQAASFSCAFTQFKLNKYELLIK